MQERAALLRSLHSQEDHVLAERERQLNLTRLRRESRQAALENNFENAALLLDLARKQEVRFNIYPVLLYIENCIINLMLNKKY